MLDGEAAPTLGLTRKRVTASGWRCSHVKRSYAGRMETKTVPDHGGCVVVATVHAWQCAGCGARITFQREGTYDSLSCPHCLETPREVLRVAPVQSR
jgi:hypothetical protein